MGNQAPKLPHPLRIQMELLNSTIPQEREEENQQSAAEEEEFQNQGRFQNGRERPISTQEARKFPYNCVGPLFFRTEQLQGHGTCVLIGPRLALTAAHNVCRFHEKKRINYTNLIFYPGLSGVAAERQNIAGAKIEESHRTFSDVRGIQVKAVRIPVEYKSQNSIVYDYALLHLAQKVERKQYLSLGVGYQKLRESITNIGYRAGDVDYDRKLANQKMEEDSSGKHQVIDRARLEHYITTTGGNSGSPIIVQREGAPLVIAMHKGIIKKSKGRRLEADQRSNYARMISDDVLATIFNWQKEFYLEDFTSQITAFELDASPGRTPISVPKGIQSFLQIGQQLIFNREKNRRLQSLQYEYSQHCQEVNQLQRKVKEVVDRVQKLASQKQGLELLLKIEHRNEAMLIEQINLLTKELNNKQDENEKLQQYRFTLDSPIRSKLKNSSVSDKDTKIQKFSSSQKSPSKSSKNEALEPFWDTTPCIERFTIRGRKTILTNADNQRYQLTSKRPLPFISTTRFKICRYGSAGQMGLCMGLLLEYRKQLQSSGDSGKGNTGSVGYWSRLRNGTGMVKVDGDEEQEWRQDRFVAEQGVLVMEIDLYIPKVAFYIENTPAKPFEKQLPEIYKEQQVYLFVALANKDDIIEILP